MSAQASPWDRPDVVRWAVTLCVGAAISAAAWWLASDRVQFGDQIPFASVGVAGLLVASYAHLSWLLQGRRAVGARRLFLLGEPATRRAALTAESGDAVLLAVDGRARYHRSGCPLLDGRATTPGARGAHEAAGRRPCGVCRP
jgi:hypothetical protein